MGGRPDAAAWAGAVWHRGSLAGGGGPPQLPVSGGSASHTPINFLSGLQLEPWACSLTPALSQPSAKCDQGWGWGKSCEGRSGEGPRPPAPPPPPPRLLALACSSSVYPEASVNICLLGPSC